MINYRVYKFNQRYPKLDNNCIEIINKLFIELINNNSLESLSVKHKALKGESLINLIFKLHLLDNSFNLSEQHVSDCLLNIDTFYFRNIIYDQYVIIDKCFYNSILNLILNDTYFNIIINKFTLFIDIINIIESIHFPPGVVARIFDKLRNFDLDYDIFEWCSEMSKLIEIDPNNYSNIKIKYRKDLNDILKFDKYIKKFNIRDNKNFADLLDL